MSVGDEVRMELRAYPTLFAGCQAGWWDYTPRKEVWRSSTVNIFHVAHGTPRIKCAQAIKDVNLGPRTKVWIWEAGLRVDSVCGFRT